MYDVLEVVEILGITRRTIYTYLKKGQLKGIKFGKEWRFTKEEIERFLREGTETTKKVGNDETTRN